MDLLLGQQLYYQCLICVYLNLIYQYLFPLYFISVLIYNFEDLLYSLLTIAKKYLNIQISLYILFNYFLLYLTYIIQTKIHMLNQQSTIFPKQIKIDDYESSENNHLIILESSNLLLGAGSRTSIAAIVLAKTLHNLNNEGEIKFQGKSVLQFGCGVGLVGLYLSALGANVKLCDTAALRDLIEKNIKINRQMLKGKAQFCMGSWKKTKCLGNCKDSVQNEQISTSQANNNKQECLYHLVGKCDLTIACECGGLQDLQSQLFLMGRQGMILAFMKRQNWDEGLDQRSLQQYLNDKSYEYERITSYHPDYVDNRIAIYKINPRMPGQGTNQTASTSIEMQEQVSRKVQKMNFTD